MRRKLFIAALALLGVILLLFLAAVFYIRSGRLDLYLQAQVIEALSDFGIRAEIGSTHLDIGGSKVTLDDVKLYAGDGQQPFGQIKQMTAEFSVLSYLRREVNITRVALDQPEVWMKVDEQGRSNLDALHAPPSKAEEKENASTFLTAKFEINNAALHYDDLRQKMSAVIPFDPAQGMAGLTLTLTPREPRALVDKLNHDLALNFDKANVTYEGRRVGNIQSSASGVVHYDEKNKAEQRVDDLALKLSSDVGNLNVAGNVESFTPLKYNVPQLQATALLEKISSVFAPDLRMKGAVSFNGSGGGTDGEYEAEGKLTSNSLSAANVTVVGLQINTNVKGKGADYHANGEVTSSSFIAEGFRVNGLRIKTNVNGSGDEYNATASLTTGQATGQGAEISSARLDDAKIKGEGARFNASAALNVAAFKSDRVTVNNLSGRLTADRSKASLESFTANLLGGTVGGNATVAYSGGASSVDVQFRSIDLDQAATAAAAKQVQVRGTANGTAQLQFPGLDYQAATGRVDATFDAAVSPPQSDADPLPGKGEVALVATGHGFNIERAFIRSNNSDLTVTGTVGWKGEASLDVKFNSQEMAEMQRVVEAFGFVTEEMKTQYPVALSGPGQFTGRLQGTLDNPSVNGHIKLDSIQSQGDTVLDVPPQEVGSFEADIAYTPALLRVDNAALVRPDGSRADFSLTARLDAQAEKDKNGIAIKANVQSFDLPSLVRVAQPALANLIGRGTITGTIDLRGLPGPRSIEGTANLSLNAGEFQLPSPQEGQEETKISIPEFTGNITFANSELSVQNMRMRIGNESEVEGEGRFNLDTYAYSLNAQGKHVDLSDLSQKLSESVRMTGTADVSVTGQGKWGNADDWSELNLNAQIQGQNVSFNGRDLGNAKVVAFTENGLLKVEATANVLDQPRTLTATVDLRDREAYPVSAGIEFTDTDIGPYLGLVAPGLSGISGTATGTIKLNGPLRDPDKIQAVANITKLQFGGAINERQRYTIANQEPIVVTATPAGVSVSRVTFTGEGTSITIEGMLARNGGAQSRLNVNGEVNLRLVSSFTQIIFMTGIARVDASLVGSLDSPQMLGVATLRNIGVRVVDVPLSLARGNGTIRFTSNQAVIENFTGTSPGGGTIQLSGGAALAGLVPERWRIETNLDQVGVEYPRDTQTVMDAELTLQGNRRVQVLSGNVEVRRSAYTRDLTIEELLGNNGPFSPTFVEVGPGGGGEGIGGGGLQTTLDLRITADNTIVIKNNLADAVGSAYLNLRGDLDAPVISGRVLLSRGTVEFRRGRFELTRGILTIPPRRGADLSIDLQSEADIAGNHITVGFSGTIAKLQTTLSSDPPLPEQDIVSLVLTGNVSGQRTELAAVTQTGLGLAQSLLSASLSEQIERGTQRLFGSSGSRFSIDPLLVGRGSDPTARVTFGQRITKDLTVTYSQNLTSGPSGIERVVLVEYRLSNRFSVVGYRNERGELGFDVRLRKRF
ncbi:MAG: translocation/assembly module TamB domain-containing protein [Blastocatellia bacterium]